MEKVAFIGLGIMGLPMARHLHEASFEVNVWNRNFEKAENFISDYGGKTSTNIKEVVKDAEFVMMCLGNDDSVREITMGKEGILDAMKKGAILIDHTTDSADLARELYTKAKDRSISFIDAPVTGGQIGAENGELTIMCGGDEEAYEKACPLLSSYSNKLEHFGKAGSGQLCKMANQICIAGIVQSLAEAVNFALKAGLDADRLFKILGAGAGGSWQMMHRHNWMLRKDYKENEGFPVEWMVKDLNICLAEAEKNGSSLPITREINKRYKEIQKNINPRIDTSSLILLLK